MVQPQSQIRRNAEFHFGANLFRTSITPKCNSALRPIVALSVLLTLTCEAWSSSAAVPLTRFVQDRFAVGIWVDPPADQQTDARFAEIAEANFTFIIGIFGAGTPTAVERQLELCDKHGLKAIVSMAGLAPERLPDTNACWGYFLADEPGAGAFPDLRRTVDAL